MKVTLKDGSPRKKGEANITISKNGNMLEIGAEGFGECAAVDGEGTPIVIEFYDGKLRLLVFGDINNEDPTHTIDLEGARESARKPDPIIDAPIDGEAVAKEFAKARATKKQPSEHAKPSPAQEAPVVQSPASDPSDDDLAAFDAA